MSRRRGARDVSEGRVRAADLASKRKPATGGETFDREHLLARPVVRVVSGPEPVVVPAMVNGRELAGWERPLYAAAMRRERRAELALFAGLIG